MAYEIGQYRYSGSGCIETLTPVKSYKPVAVEGGDTETTSFQDIQIAPSNGQFIRDTDYYAKIVIPQDMNYDMSFNIKLSKQSGSSVEVYQFLKNVSITRGGDGSNVYNVVLYERSDGQIDAMIPRDYVAGTVGIQDYVYYEATTGRYYLGTGTTRYTQLNNYNDVSIIASWVHEETNNYGVFELVFRPVDDGFTHIYLQMIRTAEDYNIQNVIPETGAVEYGRKLDIDQVQVTMFQLSNLVPLMTNTGQLDRIGVWGHPGLEMIINGEDIRIGPSGYYELDALPIESLGIVAPPNDYSNMFTIDYQYTVV